MKISMFYPSNEKGISTYTKRLIKQIAIEDNSFEITSVTTPYIPQHAYNFICLVRQKIQFYRLGLQMNKGQIAHIQHEYALFGGANPLLNSYHLFRRRIKIPTVITVHEVQDIEVNKNRKTGLKGIMKKLFYLVIHEEEYMSYMNVGIFNECNAIIVHTEASKQILLQKGVNAKQITVIPHGIPIPKLSSRSIEVDKAYFRIKDKFVITLFGNVIQRKGYDFVINNLAKLPKNIIFFIAGGPHSTDTSYYESLKELSKKEGVSDRVIFHGYVHEKEVKYVMNITDLYIYPGTEITSSGVVSEGIGYNKLILASNLPYIQEINTHIPCIYTFQKENGNDFINLIEFILQNPEKNLEMKKNIETYKQLFNYKKAAQKTLIVYNEVLHAN